MRFDYAAFAMGLLSGVCIAVVMAVSIDFQAVRTNFCLPSENFATCTREWFDVFAIIAGSAAALFVIGQIRLSVQHHRELMNLNTLAMRARFSRTLRQRIEPVEDAAVKAISFTQTQAEDFQFTVRQLFEPFIGVREHVREATEALSDYDDGRLEHARRQSIQALDALDSAFRFADGKRTETGDRLASVELLKTVGDAGSRLLDFSEAYRTLTDNGSGKNLPDIKSRMSLASAIFGKKL